jgi:hypothetical protein
MHRLDFLRLAEEHHEDDGRYQQHEGDDKIDGYVVRVLLGRNKKRDGDKHNHPAHRGHE